MQLAADVPVVPQVPSYITLQGDEGELGRGGNSQVQLGYDHWAKRKAAVKLLDKELAKSQAHRERFRREAVWLWRIKDARVPRLYTFIDSLEEPCIVMEFIEGESLADRIVSKSKPQLTAMELQHIGAEVADVLVGAHAAGIMHRDIKPGNTMIGSSGAVHVIDWGIATDRPFWGQKTLSSEKPIGDTLTATDRFVGSLPLMAPEVLQPQSVGPQADVYGLGATLFCAATGHPPFEAASVQELAEKQQAEDLSPLAELRPDMPAELSQMIDQALAMDPHDRLSPVEFKEALLAVAA